MQNYNLIELNEINSKVRVAQRIFRALNHPLRAKILSILNASKDGKCAVTELYTQMGIEQSVCSQHLAILRKARIVATIRNGKYIYYSANNDSISNIASFAITMISTILK